MITPQPKIEAFHAMSIPELVRRYSIGIENFDRRVFELSDDQLDMAFLPNANVGKWPCRVLIGHLADAELAFVFRMRLVVAEEHPMLQPWDENAFIDRGVYGTDQTPKDVRQPIGGPIAAIHTLRKWHADFLRSLEPADWERTGLHPIRGEQSVKTILVYDAWHLEHHASFLNAKIERMLGPAAAG
jgi:hypothetical protein